MEHEEIYTGKHLKVCEWCASTEVPPGCYWSKGMFEVIYPCALCGDSVYPDADGITMCYTVASDQVAAFNGGDYGIEREG